MTRPLIKTQHQTSFAENFLKPLALWHYFTWVTGICSGWNWQFAISKWSLVAKFASYVNMPSSYSRSQNYLNLFKSKSGKKCETRFWPKMCLSNHKSISGKFTQSNPHWMITLSKLAVTYSAVQCYPCWGSTGQYTTGWWYRLQGWRKCGHNLTSWRRWRQGSRHDLASWRRWRHWASNWPENHNACQIKCKSRNLPTCIWISTIIYDM